MDEGEWDDFKGEKIELPPVSIPKDLLNELAEFVQNALAKENKLMSLTTEVLDELYREINDEDATASHIISYIQRRPLGCGTTCRTPRCRQHADATVQHF